MPINYGKLLQIVALLALSFLVSSLMLFLFNISPLAGMAVIFQNGFGSYQGFAVTLTMVTPLLILAVGMSIPFTARTWNIGGQGQFILGSISATWIWLVLGNSVSPPELWLVITVFGFLGGALWAIPPTLMKLFGGINEVVTTLMMNFVATFFLDYVVAGPLMGLTGKFYEVNTSAIIPSYDMLPTILPGTNVTVGLLIGLALAGLFYVVLKYSNFGYELKLIGDSQDAARYAGVSIRRTILLSMIIGGGISGVAGMVQIFGSYGALLPQVPSDITSNFGYVSIPVALISSLNPVAIVLSSVFLAGILNGGYALEVVYGIPIDVITTIFGLIIMFFLLGVSLDFRKLFRRQKVTMKTTTTATKGA